MGTKCYQLQIQCNLHQQSMLGECSEGGPQVVSDPESCPALLLPPSLVQSGLPKSKKKKKEMIRSQGLVCLCHGLLVI